ncbi:DUF1028 domain-containing protein [Variovorax sp. J31P207]|uniref:DUF1028 domain-containing protein n=1 Tax=Variovorax sp. J31P207 TaxID=3053510 RepID=UPI0025758FF8|nr:DUF1028 domain-containing protein [Variovorax sp. J31P207]MDM0071579.1 DUF1028 domain-containing protein [Variovorax sp. J31P207]
MTFSIGGLCRESGQFGFALVTSSMAVGGRAGLAAPGAGVVFSQARSDPRLGTVGIQSLVRGRSAQEALTDMVEATPHAAWRQLAVIDTAGNVASFTGEKCVSGKGAEHGEAAVAVGNGLVNDAVPTAMMRGYEAARGELLAERLVRGLEAGVAAGGESFPLRSAYLRVVYPSVPFAPVDLRVDLAEDPIVELRKLWEMWQPMADAYVQRALDPDNSPSSSAIENHAAR